MNFNIKPFLLATASEKEYRAANELANFMRAEQLPDDPPTPLAEDIQRFQNIPPFVHVQVWAAWDASGTRAVASASVEFLKMEQNKHAIQFKIEVHPDFRRRGLARQLLSKIAETARAENRSLLLTDTSDRIPAGEAFMTRLGAERGMAGHTNQLDLRDLNRDLIRQWLAPSPERAGYEIKFVEGSVPEEMIADYVALQDVMNTAPRDNLRVEDFKFTPEEYRQMERAMQARGDTHWTFYAQEKSTGKLVGFSDTAWHPNRPTILKQRGTGVVPEFRGHGIGRWLKAAMLDKVIRERPSVRFVRTGNADSNAAMLKINFELGFKHYISQTVWQIPIEKVDAYLGQKEMAHT